MNQEILIWSLHNFSNKWTQARMLPSSLALPPSTTSKTSDNGGGVPVPQNPPKKNKETTHNS